MKIEILTREIDLDATVENYIHSKMDSLESMLGKSEDVSCSFTIGKDSGSHKQGKIYFADAAIVTESKKYGARAEAENLLEAVDELKEEIAKKIRRHKDKKMSMMKRGGRMVKEFLRKVKR